MGHPPFEKGNTIGFRKGQSGNPAGRSRIDPKIRETIRKMSPEVFERLKQIVMGSESDAASVSAAKLLLAYAWGSPEALYEDDDRNTPKQVQLTVEEKQAMARRLLAEQNIPDAADDDDDDGAETEH